MSVEHLKRNLKKAIEEAQDDGVSASQISETLINEAFEKLFPTLGLESTLIVYTQVLRNVVSRGSMLERAKFGQA